jgi:hypothetical protein
MQITQTENTPIVLRAVMVNLFLAKLIPKGCSEYSIRNTQSVINIIIAHLLLVSGKCIFLLKK